MKDLDCDDVRKIQILLSSETGLGDLYNDVVSALLDCLEPGNDAFESEEELAGEGVVLVGVQFLEKIMSRVNQISI